MLNIKNEDQMKVAVLNELLQKHNIEHVQVDEDGTCCCIVIDDIQFWAIKGGKIRYGAGHSSPVLNELKNFKATGKTTDAFLYIIKAWLKVNNQLED